MPATIFSQALQKPSLPLRASPAIGSSLSPPSASPLNAEGKQACVQSAPVSSTSGAVEGMMPKILESVSQLSRAGARLRRGEASRHTKFSLHLIFAAAAHDHCALALPQRGYKRG